MGFPILRLPFVALKVLLDCMENVELVSVSLLSKRAERFLKACGKRNVLFFNLDNFEMSYHPKLEMTQLFLLEVARRGFPWPAEVLVSISDKSYVTINQKEPTHSRFSTSIYVESHEKLKEDGINSLIGEMAVVEDEELDDLVHFSWHTKTSGLIFLLKYFHQDLGLPFSCLTVDGENRSEDFSKTFREFVNHINSTGIVLKDVEVCDELSDEDFKFLLENVSVTGTFKSTTEASKGFKFNGTIQAESISIENAHWFSAENLMASINQKEISIFGSKLTRGEVRLFLESWKAGNFPNLRKVTLNTVEPDVFLVTDGFERRNLYVRGQGMGMALSRGIVGYGNAYGVVTKQICSYIFDMKVRFNT